jgi:hypothetical protein
LKDASFDADARVVAELCPDRLAAAFVAETHVLEGDDHCMVHGAEEVGVARARRLEAMPPGLDGSEA